MSTSTDNPHKPNFLTVMACSFVREKDSGSEKGVAVSQSLGDVDIIIDQYGKPVEGYIWSYELYPERGTFITQTS